MIKILTCLLSLLPFASFAQEKQAGATANPVISTVTARLNNYSANHSIEKAYLQFDKPYYAVGDTIYFKAYLTLGAQHKLSALSGVLYAELIGPDNKIYLSEKLPVTAGTAHGDFALPDSLKGGNYRVRAYTQWMRNEGESSFFEQTFAVGGMETKQVPESGAPKSKRSTIARKPGIRFLPEGGDLIAGNYSKIAFKAIGTDGLGIDVKGTVIDDTQAEINSFTSTHSGMGAFVLVPQPGRTYKANITYADGSTDIMDLPKAITGGYTMMVNNTAADTIRIRITAGSGMANEKLSLVAQAGDVVCYAAEKQSGGRTFTAVIPKNKFPAGVVQFTLFSQSGEPLNERLAFINNTDQLKLSAGPLAQTYTQRQKVVIELGAMNRAGKPATGSFSVAVTDESAVPVDTLNENSILSNLLLTSDLRGEVEQPNYYFISQNEKTQADLDLLMLTQGYRHFEWKKILSVTQPSLVYQPERSLQISGNVIKHRKPAAGAKVTVFSNKGGLFMLDTIADKDGKFAFKDLVFGDSTKFIVQSRVPKGQYAVTLELDTILTPRIEIKNIVQPTSDADISPAYLGNRKRFYDEQKKFGINAHAIMLKEVVIRDKKYFTKNSKNLNGAGSGDAILTADDLKDAFGATLSSALMMKAAMFIDFKRGVPYKRIRPAGPMLMLLDGVEIDDHLFNDIDVESIQSIEIMVSPNFYTVYGTRGGSGSIEITSKKPSEYVYQRYTPGVIAYHPQGYYKAREFYSPQYDNPKTNQKIGDFRSTIYWQPDVITDKDGKASFSYFNSDNKGVYRVVIEGIDADGNLGRQVYRYTVE